MKFSIYLHFLLLIFLCTAHDVKSQNSWDPVIVEKANTGKTARYLKESEKEIIFYTNLARADGKLFADSYLDLYLKSNELIPDSFIRSLFKELEYIENLPMLYPDKELYDIARNHAIKSGKSGRQGHQGFEKRFRQAGKSFVAYGENCYYGRDNSLLIVLELLIDNGISDLGHRKNMLDPVFNFVGVSIMPHKKSGYNCVMDFGAK